MIDRNREAIARLDARMRQGVSDLLPEEDADEMLRKARPFLRDVGLSLPPLVGDEAAARIHQQIVDELSQYWLLLHSRTKATRCIDVEKKYMGIAVGRPL
jgi:hypothetical protein